jgi:phosphatidyl-myo-inositol alpha-mannosyltransferase
MVTEYAHPIVGGIAEHVHHLSRELAGMGHEVVVITGAPVADRGTVAAHDGETASRDGYRTVRVGRLVPVRTNGSTGRLCAGPRLRARVERALRGAEVVHVHGSPGPVLPLLALRGAAERRTPAVGTFHTWFPNGHWGYRLFRRYIDGSLSALERRIAVSRACARSIEGIFPGRYEVIPNGVDCRQFRPLSAHERGPEGPPRILFVGRLEPRNGLGTLLTAVARLRADCRDVVLQIVGDGAGRIRYRREAETLGLDGAVRWYGTLRDERARLFREATVLAAPVTRGSFGVILVEALASGTPVVAADNAGSREVLADAPGLIVPPSDTAALARGLARVLDEESLRARWALVGRGLAAGRYDWPHIACRVAAVYAEAVAARVMRGRARPGGWGPPSSA